MTGSKYVIWINSFSPHNNPMSSVLLCSAFCRWRNWGTQSLNYLFKISWGASSPVSLSALGFTLWWLDHITMKCPTYGFSFLCISGFPEIWIECYSFLYSMSLAQSRCSLNWKWNKIDSSCRDNRQWGFNTKNSELRRWLPSSKCGRARHHLTRKGHSQTGTKQRQEQCRRDNQKQSKTKAPHTTLPSAPKPMLNVDGLEVALRTPVKGKRGCKHSDASKFYRKTFWSSHSKAVLSPLS